MKSGDLELASAEARAEAARDRLLGTVAMLQQRLTPTALVSEAAREAGDRAGEMIEQAITYTRAHPGRVALAAAIVAAAISPRTTMALLSRLIPRRRATSVADRALTTGNQSPNHDTAHSGEP